MTTQEVLQQCTVDGNIVRLPDVTLDRKEYLAVKNKLELIGGKWKGGKAKGFVFNEDPAELLQDIANGEDRNLKKEFQFFPTPKEVSNLMIRHLPIMKDGMKYLEPSAGDGALIKALFDYYDFTFPVDCYEAMELNQKKLARMQDVEILGDDFLACDRKDYYDVVFANPPFTKNQDIKHIEKMFEVCKPGGTIITLSSPGWRWKDSLVSFKTWIEKLNAESYEIEEGAFKEAGTAIRTILLVIKKPEMAELSVPTTAVLPPTSEVVENEEQEAVNMVDEKKENTLSYSAEDLEEFKINIDKKLETAIKELEYFKGLVDKNDPDNNFEKDQLAQMIIRQEVFIDQLNKALERIEDKTYGICRVTGKLIDKPRLLAVPHATLSLEAKLGQQKEQIVEPSIQESKPKKSKEKKEKAADAVRYSDEDLRNFKTLISNKLDAAEQHLKYMKIVLDDRKKGIRVEDYEEIRPSDMENLIKSQTELIYELNYALDKVKKKTFGIDEYSRQLIPKDELLKSPTIRAMTIFTEKDDLKGLDRKCRVCGCTDNDCRQCIEKTGQPCHWVEADLCSACVTIDTAHDKIVEEKVQPAEPELSSPEDILQSIKDTNKQVDQHLQELEIMLTSNNNDMNFFQQLAQVSAQKTDLTLRIMQKDNKLTLNIMPGAKSVIKPILVTGTPQELDNEFFKTIAPALSEIKGLITNIGEVINDLEKKKEDKSAADKPQKPVANKPEKKPKPKTEKKVEKTVEPNMFG